MFRRQKNFFGNLECFFNAARKVMMIMLVAAVGFVMIPSQMVMADCDPPVGSGTSGDPYQISTLEHLCWIENTPAVWDKHFEQQNSILAIDTRSWNDGAGFLGIGSVPSFSGEYDGKGFGIYGLYLSDISSGFFWSTSATAVIKNLTLTVASVVPSSTTVLSLQGGFVGSNGGSISSCSFSGRIRASGGFVGDNGGTIELSAFKGSVGGAAFARSNGGTIRESFAMGSAERSGFISFNLGTIENCYSTCDSGGSGFVERNGWRFSPGGPIKNSYSIGLSGYNGFIGLSWWDPMFGCFWDIQTSGQPVPNPDEGATGLTTAQMKTGATFTNADWDFDNVWKMDECYVEGYPYLKRNPFNQGYIFRSGTGAVGHSWKFVAFNLNCFKIDKYNWQHQTPDGKTVLIEGATSDELVIEKLTIEDDGIYTCIAVDKDGKEQEIYQADLRVVKGGNCDINGDGRTGLEEAINALQIVSGLKTE